MKCSFWCSHLSRLATLVFPWPRRVYGGSCKIYLFITLSIIKIKGSFVRNVVFSVSTCFVASFSFSNGVACLWGKPQNLSFSNISTQVVLSFCVPNVAVSNIPTSLITCGKYQNWRIFRTKCSFSCVHVAYFETLVFLWYRRLYGRS